MPRNLIVLSDGTGQQGGLSPDELQSNIYKIYRGTGPPSTITADKQWAFYDAGIGTTPGGKPSLARRIWNWLCGATGLGLTRNIIDCYEQIITLWRPDDRVFLFGFSRGAYTVRGVATVMRLCGVPLRAEDGTLLADNPPKARAVAAEAVKQVYQYALSSRDQPHAHTRDELAVLFRQRYGSDNDGGPNAHPHFIGVFDTVAALGGRELLAYVLCAIIVVLAAVGVFAGFDAFAKTMAWFVFLMILIGGPAYLVTHIKVARGLSNLPWWKRIRILPPRFVYYDESLGYKVGAARHALSTDEGRDSFERVKWGETGRAEQLVQIWFAGNHSDIGGSYPESESRLSDIALRWMVDEAKIAAMLWDKTAVSIHPDPTGIEHDECERLIFRFAKKNQRLLTKDARLHPTVFDRLRLQRVTKSDTTGPYRPKSLRNHISCDHYYHADELIETHRAEALVEAQRLASEPEDENSKKPEGYWDRLIAEIQRRATLAPAVP